jgi:hypothetical protein
LNHQINQGKQYNQADYHPRILPHSIIGQQKFAETGQQNQRQQTFERAFDFGGTPLRVTCRTTLETRHSLGTRR